MDGQNFRERYVLPSVKGYLKSLGMSRLNLLCFSLELSPFRRLSYVYLLYYLCLLLFLLGMRIPCIKHLFAQGYGLLGLLEFSFTSLDLF